MKDNWKNLAGETKELWVKNLAFEHRGKPARFVNRDAATGIIIGYTAKTETQWGISPGIVVGVERGGVPLAELKEWMFLTIDPLPTWVTGWHWDQVENVEIMEGDARTYVKVRVERAGSPILLEEFEIDSFVHRIDLDGTRTLTLYPTKQDPA